MAVSGTVTYRPTINTVINDALAQVGAFDIESGGTPTAAQTAMALRMANYLVKTWSTRGMQLWERRWGVIFPQLNQATFILGNPGPAGDHATLSTPMDSNFIQTTLASNASGTTADLTSIVSQLNTVGSPGVTVANGFNIGIELDNGTVQWTTVNGAPVGNVVTLTAALTDSASAGNYVYCYETKLIRPLRVTEAFVRQLNGNNDTPCRIMSRQEYNMFGQKSSAGTPVQLYYDPQSNTGNLYIYPVFQNVQQVLFIQFEKPIDDFATVSDDFDMPQEWAEALMWNMAWRMCPAYQVPTSQAKEIKELALFTYETIDGWDQEIASVQMQPSNWPMMEGNR